MDSVLTKVTRTELQALRGAGASATAILKEVARVLGEPAAVSGVGFADGDQSRIGDLARLLLNHAVVFGISIDEAARRAVALAKQYAADQKLDAPGAGNASMRVERRQKRIARGGRGAPLTLEEAEELRRRGFDPALIERADEIDGPESYRRVVAELGRGQ